MRSCSPAKTARSGLVEIENRARQGIRRLGVAFARSSANCGFQHARVGIPNGIVQAVLNHAVPGVGGVYLRAELEEQKGAALAKWATALALIIRPIRVVA